MMDSDVDGATAAHLVLERGTGRAEYPLSFNQREMWAQCQLYAGTGLNNLAIEVALSGPLDVALWQKAFQEVVDRHETIRTIFPAPDGTPMQRVEPVRARMLCRDLSPTPAADQWAVVRARLDALIGPPFQLDRAPLFRAELLRLSDAESVFLFAFHHLILDGFYHTSVLHDLARA
jgi:hypothetical protein